VRRTGVEHGELTMVRLRTRALAAAGVMALMTWGIAPAVADSSTPGDGYTAPAPSKLDPAGTDQDQYCIPEADFGGGFDHPKYGFGAYRVNGVPQEQGCHSTEGAASVTVTTSHNSGTWTFDFSAEQSGTEAENRYWVEVGDVCKYGQEHYREVTAFVENVADDTKRSFNVWPEVEHVRGLYNIVDTDFANGISDGETVPIKVIENDNGIVGLRPGKYTVQFWQSDNAMAWDGSVVKRLKFTVPPCGKTGNPPVVRPSATIKRTSCAPPKFKVSLNNASSTRGVSFSVRAHKGKTSRKLTVRSVAAGSVKNVSVRGRTGEKIKVMSLGKVLAAKKVAKCAG
jgi:hypothetical protein